VSRWGTLPDGHSREFRAGEVARGIALGIVVKPGTLSDDTLPAAGSESAPARIFDPPQVEGVTWCADFLFTAKDRFVADDDTVDVAVPFGEIDDGPNFALIAILILVDPRTGRDAHSELGRNARYELNAAGRRVGTNCASHWRQHLEIGANLCGFSLAAGVRMYGATEWRVGNARKLAVEVGGANTFAR
jgi:hypothetical protein